MKTKDPIRSYYGFIGCTIILIFNISTVYAQRSQTVSPHGDLTIDLSCEDCHTSESWIPAKDTMAFNHSSQTQFPLIGKHSILGCQSCHFDLNFTEPDIIDEGCETCHVDVHQGAFIQSCTDCHNQQSFSDVDGLFIHNQTSFPLTGAHQQIECQSCHTDQSTGHFTTLDTDCYSCHAEEYVEAETIDHVASDFPITCEDCHTTLAWETAFFEHLEASGGFALLGAHSMINCGACHEIPSLEPLFSATSDQDCFSCHMDDYNHEHGGSGFPTDCQACHNVNSWDGADFNHVEASGGFELLGSHRRLDCQNCHTNNGTRLVFNPPPSNQDDCYSCHVDDYNDEHGGSGFSTDCQDCHNVNDWDDAEEFDHIEISGGFGLVGAHNELNCLSCHTDNGDLLFNPAPTNQDDCYTCHTADYNDEHTGSGFSTDCQECHTVNTWEGADFDHVDASGGFELVGAHFELNCQSCHTEDGGLVFNPPPANDQDCYSCHTADYQEEHAGSGFSTDCQDCHNVNTWDGADFDHVEVSGGFELLGAHFELNCQSCHTDDGGLVFNPVPANDQDCYSCHTADYQEEHAGSGFSTDCQDCHNVNTWEGADFDHVEVSGGFELLGSHIDLDCQSCHTNDGGLIFNPPPSSDQDCYSCHTDDYNDEHGGSGFPTDCQDCHNVNDWEDAEFDHVDVSNGFELLGAHNSLDCQSCHTDNGGLVFNPPPSSDQDCYSCHTDDYNDEHGGSGFPTDCQDCHNVNDWEDAEFDHVDVSGGFELLGAHNSLDCQSCHTDNGGLVFNPPPSSDQDCYSCHTDDYNDEHGGSGFPTDCQDCHNVNDWEDAEFDHVDVSGGFELLGAHNSLDCQSCHTDNGGLVFNPPPSSDQDCYSCHTDDYNDEHGGSGFPTDCQACHNVNDWEDADFEDHDELYFPIFSGNHREVWGNDCQTCHIASNDFSLFSCINCHEHNEPDTNDDHDEVRGYTYESTACYSCHPNGDEDDADDD